MMIWLDYDFNEIYHVNTSDEDGIFKADVIELPIVSYVHVMKSEP